MSSIGAFQMSSRKPVSTARPKDVLVDGVRGLLVVAMGSCFSSQKAIALSRVIA